MPRVQGVLVTSEPISAYDGFQFGEEQVREIGALIESGGLPMTSQHDPRTSLGGEVIGTSYRRSAEGHLQLIVEWEFGDEEWAEVERSGLRGLSISLTELVTQSGADPVASLSADAHWFSDDHLKLAHEALSKSGGPVETRRLFQFSFDPPTMVALTLLVAQVPPFTVGLATNFAYDALKHFIRGDSKPSIFSLKYSNRETGIKMTAYVETNSKRVLKRAMDTLPDALSRAGNVEFDMNEQSWKEVE